MNTPTQFFNPYRRFWVVAFLTMTSVAVSQAQDSSRFTVNLKSELYYAAFTDNNDNVIKRSTLVAIPSVGYRISRHHQINLGFLYHSDQSLIENENAKFFDDYKRFGVSLEFQGLVPLWKRLNLYYALDFRNHWGIDTSANYNKLAAYATSKSNQRKYGSELIGQVGATILLGKSRQHRLILGLPVFRVAYQKTTRKLGSTEIRREDFLFSALSSSTFILGYQFAFK